MVAALHAQRILGAWDITSPDRRNTGLFDVELDHALNSCRTVSTATLLENEQNEVLESVAQHLRTAANGTPYQVEAGLTLLRHLSGRVN